MTSKQLGISHTVYEEFEVFIGELTKIKKKHVTANDGLHFLLEFYKEAKDTLGLLKQPPEAPSK